MTTGHEILKPYSIPDNMREQIAAAIDKEIAKAKEEQRDKFANLYGTEEIEAPVGNSCYGEAYQDGWIAGTKAYSEAIRNNKE